MKREIILYAVLAGLIYLVVNSYITISHLKVEITTIQSSISAFEDYNKTKAEREITNQENILIIKEKHKSDIESIINLNDFISDLNKVTK